MSYQQHSICAPTISCHKCAILMALPIYISCFACTLSLQVSCFVSSDFCSPSRLIVPKTYRDFESQQPRLHLFFVRRRSRQTGIYKYKGGTGGKGESPLRPWPSLFSATYRKFWRHFGDDGNTIQQGDSFSAERERERASLAAAVRRSRSVEGKDFLRCEDVGTVRMFWKVLNAWFLPRCVDMWVQYRGKFKHFKCCLIDLSLILVWYLSNSIWNTSISGVKSSWTSL